MSTEQRGLLNCWEEGGGQPAPPSIPQEVNGGSPREGPEGTNFLSTPNTKVLKPKQSGLFDFSDVEAIKQRVRDQKLKPNPYSVHDFYYEAGLFQAIAKHSLFENLTLGVIVLNALWISFDTDGNTADTIIDAKPVYVAADSLFFGYFTLELFIRFMAFKSKTNCCKDPWFVFDSTLVALYLFDPFCIGIMAAMSGGKGLNLPTAILRLFRLARLSRLVRMLRSLPELMIMIKGMLSAAASVGYTLGLLLVITYVFSIALRNLVPKGSNAEETYFRSVPEGMHNLIIFGTFLDNLADFVLDVKEDSAICLFLCWSYIALSALTVMNMLIGVLCEVISAVAEEEKESMMIDKVKDKFGSVINSLDVNHDGVISWEEFKKIVNIPEALRALESVNVNPENLVDVAEDFFFEDETPVALTFEQFMTMVLDLRGGQIASVKDIMAMGKRCSANVIMVKGRMDVVDNKLQRLDDCLSKFAR
jgi:hypothetical protein